MRACLQSGPRSGVSITQAIPAELSAILIIEWFRVFDVASTALRSWSQCETGCLDFDSSSRNSTGYSTTASDTFFSLPPLFCYKTYNVYVVYIGGNHRIASVFYFIAIFFVFSILQRNSSLAWEQLSVYMYIYFFSFMKLN